MTTRTGTSVRHHSSSLVGAAYVDRMYFSVHKLILGRRTLQSLPCQLHGVTAAVNVQKNLERNCGLHVLRQIVQFLQTVYHVVPDISA